MILILIFCCLIISFLIHDQISSKKYKIIFFRFKYHFTLGTNYENVRLNYEIILLIAWARNILIFYYICSFASTHWESFTFLECSKISHSSYLRIIYNFNMMLHILGCVCNPFVRDSFLELVNLRQGFMFLSCDNILF